MCGIVGLFIKQPALEPELGALLVPMLTALGERGPDSTGIAVYHRIDGDRWRISLRRAQPSVVWDDVLEGLLTAAATAAIAFEADLSAVGDCARLTTDLDPHLVRDVLLETGAGVDVLGFGRGVEIIKDIGSAAAVSERFAIHTRTGYQGIGHTRMATESAVTARHSHPFSPAADLCLVHNGSFSNHATVRRRLQAEGVTFDSDNDSEVAARLIASRLEAGDDLEEAMRWVQKELDGFFTLLVTSATQFSVVRDAFACKPAVVAETDDYVAMASEYRALAGLPGIDDAVVFEPAPESIYTWSRDVDAILTSSEGAR